MKTATRRKIAIIWSALVVAYFFWEADQYRGLYQWLAELQIAWLGWYMPMLTFGVLTLLFAIPGVFIALRRATSKARRTSGQAVAPAALLRRRIMHSLFGFGTALILLGICIPIWASIRLPDGSGSLKTLSIGPDAPSFPGDGPAHLTGISSSGRVALYGQWWPRTTSRTAFSPVFTSGADDRVIRYFVQLSDAELGTQPPALTSGDRSGYLVRGEMPGTVLALYRHNGYRVDQGYYTLYTSAADLRFRYWILAVQFIVSGLIVLLLALWQRRYVRKMLPAESAEVLV